MRRWWWRWNTPKVTYMENMFKEARVFNSDMTHGQGGLVMCGAVLGGATSCIQPE